MHGTSIERSVPLQRIGFILLIFSALLVPLTMHAQCVAAVDHQSLLFPAYAHIINLAMLAPYSVGELSIILWLLIKVARDEPADGSPRAPIASA